MKFTKPVLAVILMTYALLGILFAVRTPAWQAPDEPAHYNYVRYLAEHNDFPVLRMGDYPHAYLEEIKRRKFPPELSIDPIRYEFHQPPLYYALLMPVYGLARDTGLLLLPLRLVSVLIGAGVVLLTYATTQRALPGQPTLALGAAAFVAFLPQHLATVSQVGNDVLAELLLAAVFFILVGWLAEGRETGGGRAQMRTAARPVRASRSAFIRVLLGCLLGLVLITKTTAYIAVPLSGGVLVWLWRRERAAARRVLGDALLVIVPMAVIALPWYARNVAIYGWPDFLGLIRHDQIVVGQTRTAEYLAQVGLVAYLRRAVEFTFKSFWGVFGWLGVFMDSRVYFLLAVLSGVVLAGWVVRGVNRQLPAINRKSADRPTSGPSFMFDTSHRRTGVFMALAVLLTLLTYVGYNTQFVQHQGRYLFTALIPLAIAFAIGWEAALQPRVSLILAAGLGALAVLLAAWGELSGAGLPKWPLLITGLVAAGLLINAWLPAKLRPLLRPLFLAAPYGLLVTVALYGLFGAIGPQLAR